MIYVIWALLNMALVALFIVLCYKAVVLIKQRYGTVLAFMFALFLISTCNDSGRSSGNTAIASEAQKWEADSEENYPGLNKNFVDVQIADNPMFSTSLLIEYMVTESGSIIPLSGHASVEGIQSGVKWECTYVTMNLDGSQLHYEVHGTLDWKLLYLGHHYQQKTYKGTVDLPEAIRKEKRRSFSWTTDVAR
jgi:hypothetical protein